MGTTINEIKTQLLILDGSNQNKIDEASEELIKLCNIKDDNDWQKLPPFLYRIQTVIGDSYRKRFFHLIAKLKPLEFTIYILSPFIYEKAENKIVSEKELIISSVKVAMQRSDEIDRKTELIDELEHLVAHYAKKNCGEKIASFIAEGVTCALPTATFDDVTTIRQAYWNKQQWSNADPHRVHRTIRINGLPFAEGAFVFLMAYYAHEYGINLKIENIPWQDVGSALLTNRIDVAVHNTSILENQLRGLQHLANNRILYKTEEKIFQYKGYYILGRIAIPKTTRKIYKKISGEERSRVAVVQNSDHENIFMGWWGKISKGNRPAENVWFPVRTPDEALEAVVDGSVDYCIVGGIHKTYALEKFPDIFKDEGNYCLKLTEHENVNLYFWSVSSREVDSSMLLYDLTTLWTQVVSNWSSVKYSQNKNNKELQSSCVAFVNGQPNKVFVEEFKDGLEKLIDDHNDLYLPEDGKIVSESVKGWR